MTDYSILAQYILEAYLRNISGKNLEDIFVDAEPESRVMVGKLAANRVSKSLDGGYVETKENEFVSIPSINLSFSIKKDNQAVIRIKPRGLLMYTVKPDYVKTVEYVLNDFSRKNNCLYKSIDELKWFSQKFEVPLTYRKVQISDYLGEGFALSFSGLKEMNFNLQDYIEKRLYDLMDKISNEIRICNERRISIDDLLTEEAFDKATNPKDQKVNPVWQLDVYCSISDLGDSWGINLQMVNRTIEERASLGYIPVIFDVGLSVTGNEHVIFNNIELENLLSSFKKRQPIYATSENTSVRYYPELNMLDTDNVPYYIQYRLRTNDALNKHTAFKALLDNPIENLRCISLEMTDDYARCNKEYRESTELTEEAKEKFKTALADYENEIKRFNKGIEMIECHEYVKKAFVCMLETFMTNFPEERRSITGWRLFQIVFIVSMIPEVIRGEYKDDDSNPELGNANLLYFPTGGGKTEAFLGVCVFNLFFDRFRGKEEGITAFLKYPLRLLAVQQLDRILSIIMKANKVLHNNCLDGCSDFSVGFYVGSGITPNKIDSNFIDDAYVLNQKYRFIDTCPVCGKKRVNVKYDSDRHTLRHYCDNPACEYNELPLVIIDDEIYRYLPSIVVCTIDKMSALGLNQSFKALFGQVKSYCPKHGFSVTSKCSYWNCKEHVYPVTSLKDPIPTLFIQDELHLVKESLGTFDSHYEAFIDYYCKNLVPESQRKQIRYVGATATISRYKDHVQHLYHKYATRFPCEYPSKESGRDFYSYTDKNDIARILVGFAPYGQHSITDGMWRSVYEMHRLIYNLMQDRDNHHSELKKRGFRGNIDDYSDMLLNYWIELVYNNRKNDADELMNSFTNQANNALLAEGIEQFNIKSMTSDEDFQNVRKILFNIQENHKNLSSTNLILATSTISHGVDEESFNSMFFFGMPNNNAEYIQAYSRVGRKYSGLVVDIIRLIRLRDRSYLRNFVIFHANKDELVETVPINRWARNAIYNTLPGLLAGIFLQYYCPKSHIEGLDYKAVKLHKMIEAGVVTSSEVADLLIAILGCNEGEKLSMIYVDIIKKEVVNILDNIGNNNSLSNEGIGDAIKMYSKGHREPMKSLRDTQEQVYIDIKD